jgi:hypothetical protein
LPASLAIPKLVTLKTLGDVRELLGHLPKEHQAKTTWRHVAKTLDDAARGGDARKACYHRAMSEPRRFPPPWHAEETDVCFIVRDAKVRARDRDWFYWD